MVTTDHIRSSFASSIKDGSTIKNRYCISTLFAYTIEGSVFSCNVSIVVLWPGCSIREISLEVVWYHIQDATYLSEQMEKISSSSYAKLNGKVESDESYIKVGLKGRSYHDEIVKSIGRKPRKR